MKIYTLENKNSEVLAILSHSDNMNYRDFKRIMRPRTIIIS